MGTFLLSFQGDTIKEFQQGIRGLDGDNPLHPPAMLQELANIASRTAQRVNFTHKRRSLRG
jgi:hypothetical protein